MSARGTPDSSSLVLYDDHVARRFEPFALTRPVATLTAGTLPTWERWQLALPGSADGLIAAPHLEELDEPPRWATGVLRRGTVVANSRFAPALEMRRWRGIPAGAEPGGYLSDDGTADSWWSNGRVAAIRLDRDLAVERFADGSLVLEELYDSSGRRAEIAGWWHDEVWDYVRHLSATLTDDIGRMRALRLWGSHADGWVAPAGATVMGTHPVLLHGETAGRPLWSFTPGTPNPPAAIVEPHVLFDATSGPICVDSGARIRAFTRLNGPCYVGPHTTVAGGEVGNCSIGPHCKVRGEISSSIFLGYANKGHDGFLGHSYVGRWVNLGAGTTTSNLKNTYGSVALWTPDGLRDTGMQFLGTLFGDHVKTGIGTMLTTGTVLGAGANVYGAGMPPKVVPPFSWGDGEPYDVYRLDRFLENAQRMMERRHVPLTDRMRRQLGESHRLRWTGASR